MSCQLAVVQTYSPTLHLMQCTVVRTVIVLNTAQNCWEWPVKCERLITEMWRQVIHSTTSNIWGYVDCIPAAWLFQHSTILTRVVCQTMDRTRSINRISTRLAVPPIVLLLSASTVVLLHTGIHIHNPSLYTEEITLYSMWSQTKLNFTFMPTHWHWPALLRQKGWQLNLVPLSWSGRSRWVEVSSH